MSDPNLVITCNFNSRNYFVKMHIDNNILELVVTDKQTGEDWQCCYDATYIENLTQKTGNFKQFKIFTAMLKSGLLKTSNSVYLDLLTFSDLDALRNHRIRGLYTAYHFSKSNNNRRYLILTYTAEFDRIHYPIPLEYCGPPDPQILQQTINKLEEEIVHLKEDAKSKSVTRRDSKTLNLLQKRVEDLAEENNHLKNETARLTQLLTNRKNSKTQIMMLQNAIKNLEKSVLSERKSHHELVDKLRRDKLYLTKELDRTKQSEKILIQQLQNIAAATPRVRTAPAKSNQKTRDNSRPCSSYGLNDIRNRSSNSRIAESRLRQESRSPSPLKKISKGQFNPGNKKDLDGRGDNQRSTSPLFYNDRFVSHNSRPISKRRSARTKIRKNPSDTETSDKEPIWKSSSRLKPVMSSRSRSASQSSRSRSRSSSVASHQNQNQNQNQNDNEVREEHSIQALMNRISCPASPRRDISRTSIDRNFSSLENRISYLQKIVDDSLHISM